MEIPAHLIDAGEEERIHKRIFHDRVKILNGHLLKTTIPATLLCSIVLFIALFRVTETVLITCWLISVLAVSAFRIFLYVLYRRNPDQDKSNLRLFIVGTTMAALTWSVAGTVLMPAHDLYHLALSLIIIAGITAGSSQTLQASLAANRLFIILAILPLALWLMHQNEHVYIILSIAVLGYLIFMLQIAMRGYRQLVDAIKLRHINEFLVARLSGINQDLTNEITERKKSQEQLDYLATHDALTKIPNRLSFNLIFSKALARAQRHSLGLTVMYIDVDYFKGVNDRYGHAMGDLVLYRVARRLKRHLRATDTVARIGGDEFIVLLEDAAGTEFISKFTKRITRTFAKPIRVKEHYLPVSLSVGISCYPTDGSDPNILLKKADIALYHAKNSGRNRVEHYHPTIHEKETT